MRADELTGRSQLNDQMQNPPPAVSAIVLTLNEERNLPACLDSLAGWVREIFLVDSGSTDRTAEIARARGAVVVVNESEGHARLARWLCQERK